MSNEELKNNSIETISFNLIEQMNQDHHAASEIYHASKFWEKLNQLNVEWLKKDGLENFKRTVNNNYFNWMVTTKSVYFRNVAQFYFHNIARHPDKLLKLFTSNVGEMFHRTYVSTNTKVSYVQRKVYALYLLFLYEYVRAQDKFGIFEKLEEPNIGNPIFIEINGKHISQDISNSYMEYSYIRSSLGNSFSDVKTIAEIGGGYGRLSYLFHLLHQNEGVKIVLIDLPPALYVAHWYLHEVFPEAKIMDYRNFTHFSEVEQEFNESSICFLLPHQIELLPKGTLDLLINVSSLQEMSREQINYYYELVNEKAKYFYTKQWVLWENSEDKMTVPAIIYPTKPTWEVVAARLNPVHTEFFEAIFKIK
ncbi:putative sugar O-methyltransferase [Methylotenera sp.]|uniref:putative sugar O-methyltransferase n=1 Tax=Methylotenera sp. TaxID=2051956 RepID=UPI00248892A5|nr:putative sugar O-methyltransferase [Methylotenera sp.]MDI1299687.1 putative sugar O-methyltransferase [Methylotenera sp.]